MKKVIRFLLPAISVFAWIYKGEGDSWLHSFFLWLLCNICAIITVLYKVGNKGICMLWIGVACSFGFIPVHG